MLQYCIRLHAPPPARPLRKEHLSRGLSLRFAKSGPNACLPACLPAISGPYHIHPRDTSTTPLHALSTSSPCCVPANLVIDECPGASTPPCPSRPFIQYSSTITHKILVTSVHPRRPRRPLLPHNPLHSEEDSRTPTTRAEAQATEACWRQLRTGEQVSKATVRYGRATTQDQLVPGQGVGADTAFAALLCPSPRQR